MPAKNLSYPNPMKVFYGNSNPELGKKICHDLRVKPGKAEFRRHADGEVYVQIRENVRHMDVYIIQSTNSPAENLLELYLFIDAARRASAGRINVVIPYFAYSRQERKDKPRTPISARVIARQIEQLGADRIVTVDLHAGAIQGFVDIPVDHLWARLFLADNLRYHLAKHKHKKLTPKNACVVAPDAGAMAESEKVAEFLRLPMISAYKNRDVNTGNVRIKIMGRPNPICLVFDDIGATFGTNQKLGQALAQVEDNHTGKRIVKELYISVVHGLYAGSALEKIAGIPNLQEICQTNTVALSKEKEETLVNTIPSFHQFPIEKLLAKAIRSIHTGRSVSGLYQYRTNGPKKK